VNQSPWSKGNRGEGKLHNRTHNKRTHRICCVTHHLIKHHITQTIRKGRRRGQTPYAHTEASTLTERAQQLSWTTSILLRLALSACNACRSKDGVYTTLPNMLILHEYWAHSCVKHARCTTHSATHNISTQHLLHCFRLFSFFTASQTYLAHFQGGCCTVSRGMCFPRRVQRVAAVLCVVCHHALTLFCPLGVSGVLFACGNRERWLDTGCWERRSVTQQTSIQSSDAHSHDRKCDNNQRRTSVTWLEWDVVRLCAAACNHVLQAVWRSDT